MLILTYFAYRGAVYIFFQGALSKFTLEETEAKRPGDLICSQKMDAPSSFTVIGDYVYLIYKGKKQVKRLDKYSLGQRQSDPTCKVYKKTIQTQQGEDELVIVV